MEKVIVFYKDKSVKLKPINNFLPKTRNKLKQIDRFLIPILDKNVPVYIPVRPTKLLYSKKFIISSCINIISIDTENESLFEDITDLMVDDKVIDNLYEFILNVYFIYKLIGFNIFYTNLSIINDYYHISLFRVPYLKIKFLDKDKLVDTFTIINDDITYIDTINYGTECINHKIERELQEFLFFPVVGSQYSKNDQIFAFHNHRYKYISLKKILKSEYEFILLPMEYYNSYYLMSISDYIESLKMNHIFMYLYVSAIDDDYFLEYDLSKLTLMDRSQILKDLDYGYIDYYDIFMLKIYNIYDLIIILTYIQDIVVYIDFLLMHELSYKFTSCTLLTVKNDLNEELFIVDELSSNKFYRILFKALYGGK
jgi:hypothetical protein